MHFARNGTLQLGKGWSTQCRWKVLVTLMHPSFKECTVHTMKWVATAVNRNKLYICCTPGWVDSHRALNYKVDIDDLVRGQELCESRGGRPGLPVPDGPYFLSGCKSSIWKRRWLGPSSGRKTLNLAVFQTPLNEVFGILHGSRPA